MDVNFKNAYASPINHGQPSYTHDAVYGRKTYVGYQDMIISNIRVIQKNETRINKIHQHEQRLFNIKININKRNALNFTSYSNIGS